jgi:O-acetyl-ADP-ribose deacetylase (regulator of RNase III)
MIRVLHAELADTDAAAVMRPVSAEWDPVTPATRRLELAAGMGLVEACRRLGDLPVGSAVITGAGDLRSEFMVHVVVRSIDEQVTEAIVRRGLQNGLRRLAQMRIESVAMAPLGTGAGNLDTEDSAREMIPILLEHLADGAEPSRIDLIVDCDYDKEVFERELKRYDLPFLPGADKESLSLTPLTDSAITPPRGG